MPIRLWVVAVVIVILIAAWFALSVPHTRGVYAPVAMRMLATSTEPVVMLRDTYHKGVHTLSGTLEAPDACTFTTATATLVGASSSAESIALTILMPLDTGVCLQEAQQTTFSAMLTAPPGLPITTTVNGILASTSAL